jgi:hypothetical protein
MDLIERMVAAIDAAPEQGSGVAAPATLVRLVRDFERETRATSFGIANKTFSRISPNRAVSRS